MDRRRLMVWLAFASMAMSVAICNIEKFAARPSLPKDWLDVSEQQAVELAHQIDGGKLPPSRENLQRYFWLLLEAGNRKHGHDTAANIDPVRPDPSHYDIEYVERLRRLACGELMHDRVEDMLHTLRHLYQYDCKYLAPSDIRLARDFNNMGLLCLLAGQHAIDADSRYQLYQQAAEWLKKAESAIPQSNKTDFVSVKENQLMLAEAINDKQWAHECRRSMDSLLREINGPAPLVTLD